MTVRRMLAPVVSVLALLMLATAPAASAAPDVDQAAAALRGGASVYSDPAAELALSDAEVADLTSQVSAVLSDQGVPIFIAVLPESAAGGAQASEVASTLGNAIGLDGVYAVVVGNQFRADSTSATFPAPALATQAFQEGKDGGVPAVLSRFVTLVGEEAGGSATSSGSSSEGGAGGLVVLLILFIGGAIVVVVLVRKSRKKQALQLAAVQRTVDQDITEYGERLGALSLDDPDFDDATRTDMQRALDSYDTAKSAVRAMRSPADATAVTTALEDGRYALACVDARLAQQPLPERRPPCFVDPRHGPSVADVSWTPPGLAARDVPMCAACRTAVETGQQPQGLEVATAAGPRPYWQAGPEYAPYARGYYSPFGDVMTAVVVGTMMSSMWHAPGITTAATDTAGFGGWGGGGDGGGGFGGGGDFGGGDFGGGGDF